MSYYSNERTTSRKIEDIVAGSIASELETANSHLRNHVTREGKILGLDKDCEYCLVYFDY
jgi:hypothetical protein